MSRSPSQCLHYIDVPEVEVVRAIILHDAVTKLMPVRSASKMTKSACCYRILRVVSVVQACSLFHRILQTLMKAAMVLDQAKDVIVHNAGMEEVLRKHKIVLFFITLWNTMEC